MFSLCHIVNCVDVVPLQGVFMDDAAGLRDTDVAYVDTNSEQIERIPETALHRSVDSAIANADKEGRPTL